MIRQRTLVPPPPPPSLPPGTLNTPEMTTPTYHECSGTTQVYVRPRYKIYLG